MGGGAWSQDTGVSVACGLTVESGRRFVGAGHLTGLRFHGRIAIGLSPHLPLEVGAKRRPGLSLQPTALGT